MSSHCALFIPWPVPFDGIQHLQHPNPLSNLLDVDTYSQFKPQIRSRYYEIIICQTSKGLEMSMLDNFFGISFNHLIMKFLQTKQK